MQLDRLFHQEPLSTKKLETTPHMSYDATNPDPIEQPETGSWQPLDYRQRRVIGVLVEKAKTTPDGYPMTLNAITTAANQKSNRSPQMKIEADDVLLVLDELREIGAVVEVQAGGRAAKYKHMMYEWLDVNKYEIAVMAELLLRGQQTLSELRSRASRMETIADLGALKPVVESLLEKKLMIELTPPGRGQIVTHNLYEEPELRRIQELLSQSPPPTPVSSPTPAAKGHSALEETVAELAAELAALRLRVEKIESDLS